MMRPIDRHDTSVVVGVVLGALLLAQQPIRLLIDSGASIGLRYGFDVVADVALLIVVFGVHHLWQRRRTCDHPLAAAVPPATTEDSSPQLDRLIAMGRALGSALDHTSIRDVFRRYLPSLAEGRQVWMITRTADGWDRTMSESAAANHETGAMLDLLVHRALNEAALVEVDTYGSLLDDNLCLPMLVGESAVGVVGVRNDPPIDLAQHNVLSAAVALLAISTRNSQLLWQTRESSIRDGLTGCFNRSHAIDTLSSELRRASRTACPLSVVMFDIDEFKAVNDRYGHLVGDAMLAAIGGRLDTMLRTSDVRCRYGGDEFLVLLPDTPLAGAERVAAQLAQAVSGIEVGTPDGHISPTISLGVALAADGELEPTRVIGCADEALYRAKREGRNRFAAAPLAATL